MEAKAITLKNTNQTLKALVTLALGTLISISAMAQLTDALKLTIDGNSYTDECVIRYIDGATVGFDGNYDAWKIFGSNQAIPQLFTNTDGGDPLAINALGKLVSDNLVPIYGKIGVAGNYNITPSFLGNFDSNIKLYITDVASGSVYELVADQAIPVYLDENDGSSPIFEVIVSTPVEIITFDATCNDAANGQAIIADLGNTDWGFTITDENGDEVEAQSNISESITIDNLYPGAYTLHTNSPVGTAETVDFTVVGPEAINAVFASNAMNILLSDGGNVNFYNFTENAESYFWDFGDGNTSTEEEPHHIYEEEGTYTVQLIAYSGDCQEATEIEVTVIDDATTSTSNMYEEYSKPSFYSDAAGSYVQTNANVPGDLSINVFSLAGQHVTSINDENVTTKLYKLNLNDHSEGLYVISVEHGGEAFNQKVYLSK